MVEFREDPELHPIIRLCQQSISSDRQTDRQGVGTTNDHLIDRGKAQDIIAIGLSVEVSEASCI